MGTFGNYPLKILPAGISASLTFVLPLAFIAYFPVAVLTGHASGLGVPSMLAAAAPAVGAASFVGSRILWNASLRRYKGVNG
jgi:ABC-2 type transport system permease protein